MSWKRVTANMKWKGSETQIVKGEPEFLTAWKGYPIEEAGWEPMGSFIHRYSSDLVTYAREHGLMDLPILKHLTAHLRDVEGRATGTR